MTVAAVRPRQSRAVDLTRAPIIGPFLRWRHARLAVQVPLLLIAALVIYDGLFGPQLAPKNFAGVLPWVHWRGFVVLALLIAGNLFCFACPFMLPRRLAKKLLPADRAWPVALRSKWLAVALLIVFFWAYEAFDLWASPWLTAWVALTYFAAAFAIDGFFKGAAFCKYVCPIGQFHFVNSLVSPLEVRVRAPERCADCRTKDCIRGRPFEAPRDLQLQPVASAAAAPASASRQRLPVLNGCELWLFQERKAGNMDCTFCLDCVHACPHDNVGILARSPMQEFRSDPRRSSIGRFSDRPDIAALAVVLVFGAFLNAFGMVPPVYELEEWLAGLLGTRSEPLVLGILFAVGFVLLPVVSIGLAAWASRALSGERASLLQVATRYSFGLVPLGFGMWLAHYSFHFLVGALTVIPVTQSFLVDIGLPLLGEPNWALAAVVSEEWLGRIELLLLDLGVLATIFATYTIARREHRPAAARRAVLPWAVIALALFAAGIVLLSLPMEMRGTFA